MKLEDNRNVDGFIKVLMDFNGSDESLREGDYPNNISCLINIALENNINLDENNITVVNEKIDIDGDGVPFVESDLFIETLKVSVKISCYHHRNWDFYVSDLKVETTNNTSKTLMKELRKIVNQWDECELDECDEILGEYMKDESNIYIEKDDGILIIPYSQACDIKDTWSAYEVLELECAYIAKENIDTVNSIIKKHEKILNLLKTTK